MTTSAANPHAETGPVIIRNPGHPAPPPIPPRRADGQPWHYEMIYSGGALRAYAQTPSALLEALHTGYRDLTQTAAAESRLRLACDVQVRLQAELASGPTLADCTAAQRQVLLGDFSTPPAVPEWDAPIPLVLVRSFYAPFGHLPAPAGEAIIWLDPSDDWELLRSLAHTGVIALATTGEDGPDDGAGDGAGDDAGDDAGSA